MWKLDFYVLPSNSYQDISENDVYEFGERAVFLNKTEKLYTITIQKYTYKIKMCSSYF